MVDATTEDWESMLDSGQLDKSLEQLALSSSRSSCQPLPPQAAAASDRPASANSSSVAARQMLDDPFFGGPVRILTHDGSAARTQYRPPEPQLKILKRPTSEIGPAKKAADNQSGPKVSQKSLKQREAEYAEARLRILGSQQPQTENKPANNNNGQKIVTINGQQQQQRGNNGQQRNGNAQPRPPRGPDGSRGFQLAR